MRISNVETVETAEPKSTSKPSSISLSSHKFGMHVYEGTSKQKKVNELVNIDGLSGLVALKPVGKMRFAPSHTLLFSCSIVRDIWSVANQRAR